MTAKEARKITNEVLIEKMLVIEEYVTKARKRIDEDILKKLKKVEILHHIINLLKPTKPMLLKKA